MTAQAVIAASWMQGKITPEEQARIKTEQLVAEQKKKWTECFKCHKLAPRGGFGMCRKCYAKWHAAQLADGHCGVCGKDHVKLRTARPPVCIACNSKRQRAREREILPEEERKARRAKYTRNRRTKPGGAEKEKQYRDAYLAPGTEAYKRKLEYNRQYKAKRLATMTPEEIEREKVLVNEKKRIQREQARTKNRPPVRVPEPKLTVHLIQDAGAKQAPILPEGTFREALEFRREPMRPRKAYRRRHAA